MFHLNLPHLKIFLGFSSLISQPGVEKQSNSPYTGTSAVTVKIWKFIALPMAKHSSLLTRPSGNFVHIKNPHPLDRSILIGAIYTAQICMILRATSRRWMSQLTEAILFSAGTSLCSMASIAGITANLHDHVPWTLGAGSGAGHNERIQP